MQTTQTNEHGITFTSKVKTSSYASSYSGNILLSFEECDENGVRNKYNVSMPLEEARKLCEELAEDIIRRDVAVEELKKKLKRLKSLLAKTLY